MAEMNLNRNQQLAAIAILGFALIGLSFALIRPSLGPGAREDIKISEPGRSPERDVSISVDESPKEPRSYGGAGSQPNPGTSILVHVAGRVKFPNVYRLAPGSRGIEAIKAAGGALPDACLDAVNLAAKVKDGEQIYVPSRNAPRTAIRLAPSASSSYPKTRAASSPFGGSASTSGKLKTPGEGYVNINTADSAELQRLPGVGPATAQKIIDYRAQIGRFTSAEQLMEVKGIGPKKLEKMRPFVAL